MQYLIKKTDKIPQFDNWDSELWRNAEIAGIENFHPDSSLNNRPLTMVKALHDNKNIYVFFRVEDPVILGRYVNFNDPVYTDSCVEFFFSPGASGGYFNVETNCLGAQLISHVVSGKAKRFSREEGKFIRAIPVIEGPRKIDGRIIWTMGYALDLSIFEVYTANLIPLSGGKWRGNFYKCGDDLQDPHWASWAPIGKEINFHVPEYFQPLLFE